MKAARYAIQIFLAISLPLLVQRWDVRRLSPEQRERAWNFASWGSALYAFNVFSMLGWCWVTRRSLWGVVLGIATSLLLLAVLAMLDYGVACALGMPETPPWQVVL